MPNKYKEKTNKSKTYDELREKEDLNEKTVFSMAEVMIIMIICIVFGLLIGGFVVSEKTGNVGKAQRIDFNEINGLYDDINKNYYGTYTSDSFRDSTIEGMLSYLADPYARLITNDYATLYTASLESELIGVGMELDKLEDDYPVIKKVYKNSPASKAKLKENMVVLSINDEDLKDMFIDDMNSMLRGGKTKEKVKIKYIADEEEKELTLSKEIIQLPTVEYTIIEYNNKNIVELTIKNFSKNTYEEFKDIYEVLKDKEVDGYIIDLRGNGGGYLSAASSVASMFLDKDKIIYVEKRKNKEEKIYSRDDKIIDSNVIILIDNGTASGAEILATSLIENNSAITVGEKSYGKNTIQKMHKLKDGAIVKFTIGEWLTSSGISIKESAIVPDYEIINDISVENNSEDDLVLKKALELFG